MTAAINAMPKNLSMSNAPPNGVRVSFRRALDRTFRSQPGHAQDHGQGRCCACLRDVPQAGFLHDGRAGVWVEEIAELRPSRHRDESEGWENEPASKAHGRVANQS